MNLFGFKRPSELNKISSKRELRIQKRSNLTSAHQKGNPISDKTPTILYYMERSSLKKTCKKPTPGEKLPPGNQTTL